MIRENSPISSIGKRNGGFAMCLMRPPEPVRADSNDLHGHERDQRHGESHVDVSIRRAQEGHEHLVVLLFGSDRSRRRAHRIDRGNLIEIGAFLVRRVGRRFAGRFLFRLAPHADRADTREQARVVGKEDEDEDAADKRNQLAGQQLRPAVPSTMPRMKPTIDLD